VLEEVHYLMHHIRKHVAADVLKRGCDSDEFCSLVGLRCGNESKCKEWKIYNSIMTWFCEF
jgi:hypothetical protein